MGEGRKSRIDLNAYTPIELLRLHQTLQELHLAAYPKTGASFATASRGPSGWDSSGGPDPAGPRERYRLMLKRSLRDVTRLEEKIHRQLVGQPIPTLPRCTSCKVVVPRGVRFCEPCTRSMNDPSHR